MRVGFSGVWMVLRRGRGLGRGRSLGLDLGERKGGWMMRILVFLSIYRRDCPCFSFVVCVFVARGRLVCLGSEKNEAFGREL